MEQESLSTGGGAVSSGNPHGRPPHIQPSAHDLLRGQNGSVPDAFSVPHIDSVDGLGASSGRFDDVGQTFQRASSAGFDLPPLPPSHSPHDQYHNRGNTYYHQGGGSVHADGQYHHQGGGSVHVDGQYHHQAGSANSDGHLRHMSQQQHAIVEHQAPGLDMNSDLETITRQEFGGGEGAQHVQKRLRS